MTSDKSYATEARLNRLIAAGGGGSSGHPPTVGPSPPASPGVGDIWYATGNDLQLTVWDGAAWVPYKYGASAIADSAVTSALIATGAVTAAGIANGTITAAQINTAAGILGSQLANGTVTSAQIAAGTISLGNLSSAITARSLGGITTTIAAAAPGGAATGDMWVDTTTKTLKQYSGSAWNVVVFNAENSIQAGTITSSLIQADAITAGLIAAGAIDGQYIEGAFFICGAGGGATWETAAPTTPGFFMYYDTGTGDPQVVFSATAASGSDQWGNSWQGGLNLVGLPGVLPNTLSVVDSGGDTLSSIDSAGNLIGQTVSATSDLIVAGDSFLIDYIPPLSAGVLFRSTVLGANIGSGFPSSPTTSEVALYEIDVSLIANRDYFFEVTPINVNLGGSGAAILTVYYTNDGTTPTTSSAVFMASRVATYGTNTSQAVTIGCTCETSPTADRGYRFLVAMKTGGTGSGTPTWQIVINGQNPGAFVVLDGGAATPNTGLWIGTGGGGHTGGTAQNHTGIWTAAHTYSYEGTNSDSSPNPGYSPGARLNIDGPAMQGDDGLGDNGNTSTCITWPGAVATALSGATITSISLTLNNNHAWFDSGMTVHIGKTTAGVGGTSRPSYTDADLVSGSVSKGATKTFSLNSQRTAFGNALVAGDAFVLYDASPTRNSYGIFAGAGQGGPPKLTVKYTK